MALDPALRAAIENWWITAKPHGWIKACPVCGATGQRREAVELTPESVMLKCLLCGHAHVFDVDVLKQKVGII
jgi:transcription elongation factor Elf1